MIQTSSSTVEEYLESIYKLSTTNAPVRAVRLAEQLGVSAASVAEMVRKLVDQGLVNRSKDMEIILTAEGSKQAIRLLRRHRLSERFLTDLVGLPWDKVHDEACRFEHVLSPEVEEGLDRLLNRPDTCPHGYPIPNADGHVAANPTRPLSDFQPGGFGVVAHVPEEDSELLRYLGELGVRPGVRINIKSVAPFDGPFHIEIDGKTHAIGKDLAQRIVLAD